MGVLKKPRERRGRGSRARVKRACFWLRGFFSTSFPAKKPKVWFLTLPLPHSDYWPITLFNALDPSSWKQRKQHAT